MGFQSEDPARTAAAMAFREAAKLATLALEAAREAERLNEAGSHDAAWEAVGRSRGLNEAASRAMALGELL